MKHSLNIKCLYDQYIDNSIEQLGQQAETLNDTQLEYDMNVVATKTDNELTSESFVNQCKQISFVPYHFGGQTGCKMIKYVVDFNIKDKTRGFLA